MSQTSKIVLGIAVVVIVLIGAYFIWHRTASAPETTGQAQGTGSPEETTTLPSGSNTSDAAIDQDLTSIDTQIQAVDTDNASAADSINTAASAQ